jgi:hypothetical protein
LLNGIRQTAESNHVDPNTSMVRRQGTIIEPSRRMLKRVTFSASYDVCSFTIYGAGLDSFLAQFVAVRQSPSS